MSDIELVIKIPEEMYEIIQDSTKYIDEVARVCEDAVKVGTPLLSGHGRLIDADALMRDYGNPDIEILLDNMDTIIEADKEERDISNKTKINKILHRIANTPQQVYQGDYGAER